MRWEYGEFIPMTGFSTVERVKEILMRLQNILFPSGEGCEKELYIRTSELPYKRNPTMIFKGERLSTDTYMNAFDIAAWKKYTDVSELSFAWKLNGNGILKVFQKEEGRGAVCLTEKIMENHPDAFYEGKYHIEEFEKLTKGLLYIEFYACTDSFLEAWFETDNFDRDEIKISIVICTFKRKKQLEQIIHTIRGRMGDTAHDNGNDWLRVIIVDNASELPDQYGEGITVFHNPNTGGSGGFSRGMKETVRNLSEFQATHVVLMDDDVILQMESIFRLRALLTYVRPEYEQETVAGRMFRLDRPYVQYTAAEIWNGGDIRHIGWNQDMTDRQSLWNMNENAGGEYSGWWFACFPIEFVKENEPLPFFLHCDDVEYGLRHGGTPIVLNGIQVWHETYEYRQSPLIAYYDRRNSMIVNEIYDCNQVNRIQLWNNMIQMLKEVNNQRNYLLEYYMIRAFRDFLRGEKWFMKKDGQKLHTSLIKGVRANRYKNAMKKKALSICFFLKKDRELYTKADCHHA